jgi:hypothetical protein
MSGSYSTLNKFQQVGGSISIFFAFHTKAHNSLPNQSCHLHPASQKRISGTCVGILQVESQRHAFPFRTYCPPIIEQPNKIVKVFFIKVPSMVEGQEKRPAPLHSQAVGCNL